MRRDQTGLMPILVRVFANHADFTGVLICRG